MNAAFKDRVREIFGIIGYVGFLLGVFALITWGVYAGDWHPLVWLREVFSAIWAVAGFASILFAVMALCIQRDRRAEQSINAHFDEDFSEMYDSIEKNPAYAQSYPNWRELHLERRSAALSSAEASSWESACRFWMLATGCALAGLFMLAVTAWQCIRA